MRLVSAALLCSLAQAAPPAPWSWSTVQTFVHCSNQSGPLNDQIVALMANSAFTVIEKYQCLECAPVGTGAEQKQNEAAMAVRRVNPNATMILYFAVDYARRWFNLGNWFDAHPSAEVHNADGSLATVSSEGNTWHIFDFAVPQAQQAWVWDIANTVWTTDPVSGTRLWDGVFIDGYRGAAGWPSQLIPNATPAEQAAWIAGVNATGAMMAAALNGDGSVNDTIRLINPGSSMGEFGHGGAAYNAVSIEFFTPTAGSIAQLQQLGADGMLLTEVHGYIGGNVTLFNLSLAAYLAGVEPGQYFGAGAEWSACDDWLIPHPEYAKPLGVPDGPAVVSGGGAVFTRSFGGNATRVTIDTGKQTSCIWWADGTTTGSAC